MLNDFKEFAMRGNVMDLAVGIIVGAAFGKIISSFVGDILMPFIGMFLGNMDFSNLFINLSPTQYLTIAAAKAAGASTLNYGLFINSIVDFVIVALAIFLIVRQINKFRKPAVIVETLKECPYCFSKIDLRATKCPACVSDLAK